MSTCCTAFQWAHTIDWTVRCDWLEVASDVSCSLQVLTLIDSYYRVFSSDRPKPVFLVSVVAESGAVTEVQLRP